MPNFPFLRRIPALLAGSLPVLASYASASNADVTTEYALAQQGFAIALASNVLQSHFLYVYAATGGYPYGECSALDENDSRSGGIVVTALPTAEGDSGDAPVPVRVQIYFDATCQKLYMQADTHVAVSSGGGVDTYTVANLGTHYFATDGTTELATLTTTASVAAADGGAGQLHGLGAFVAADGAATASLGLVCAFSDDDSATHCAGGVVQDFPRLGLALGSVSLLDLVSNDDDSLDFSSPTPAAFSSAAPGGLTLGYTDASDSALHIGGGSAYGSDSVAGHAGAFSLLPPPPTSWTSTDNAHDARFSIAVSDAITRALDFSIQRISSNAILASGHLDQSGTGSILFSDGSSAQVRGWIIASASGDLIFRNGFDPAGN